MRGQEDPTVFVVDDDEAVRDSLALLLKSVGHRVEAYPSAIEFLERFDSGRHGCLVLDIRMPGMTGLELQRALNRRDSSLPIIFITAHGDIPMAVQAVREGALDFIPKPFDDAELVDKIAQAMETGERMHAEMTELKTIQNRIETLTAREREVMAEVVKGKANKVIAGDLGVSQRTIEIHRARVMEKMKANSLAHLVRMVMVAESEE